MRLLAYLKAGHWSPKVVLWHILLECVGFTSSSWLMRVSIRNVMDNSFLTHTQALTLQLHHLLHRTEEDYLAEFPQLATIHLTRALFAEWVHRLLSGLTRLELSNCQERPKFHRLSQYLGCIIPFSSLNRCRAGNLVLCLTSRSPLHALHSCNPLH
jgi:hypothetical protein